MHNFQQLFLNTNSNSDKLNHHGYHRIYPWFLGHFINKPVNLLEIGIHQTDSIKLWRSYFNEVSIYGIDINPKEFDDPSVKIFQVDQSKESQLTEFVNTVNVEFDIIIDDGSHVPDHQKLTLKKLWNLLKPGGVYIIEDIETTYWGKSEIYGYKFNSNKSKVMKSFRNCISFINREFLSKENAEKIELDDLSSVFHDVEMLSFGYNSIILVKKDVSSFKEFYRNDYRFDFKISSQKLF